MGSMLKSNLKEVRFSLFDKKAISLVSQATLKCDTLEQFETEFNAQVKNTEGFGELFKIIYYVIRSADKAQVWRRSMNASADRLLFEIVAIKY